MCATTSNVVAHRCFKSYLSIKSIGESGERLDIEFGERRPIELVSNVQDLLGTEEDGGGGVVG